MAPPTYAKFPQGGAVGLTFGLELEFLADGEGQKVNVYSSDRKRRELADHLIALVPNLPIAVKCFHEPNERCCICQDADPNLRFSLLRVFNPANPISNPGANSDYLYFLIKLEYLDCPWDKTGNPLFQGLELTSPVLDIDEIEAGLPKTSQVISALRNMPMKLTANTGCGLHIHVGVKNGLTLELVKKVITLTMLLELSLLNMLVSPQRTKNFYNAPISKLSNFTRRDTNEKLLKHALSSACPDFKRHFPTPSVLKAATWNDNDPRGWMETLKLFWQSRDFYRLMHGIARESDLKASLFVCLRDKDQIPDERFEPKEGDGNPSTVEFRYPQMSFDIGIIRNWAEIACKIVEIATYDAETFKTHIEKIIAILNQNAENNTGAIEPLLTALGLEHQIPQWKEQLERYAKGEEISFLGRDGYVLPENQEAR